MHKKIKYPSEGQIERDNRERKNKIYCSTGKNKLPEIAYLSKDLLLGLKFSL